jgi:sulfide:quinone oxidoreductase
VVGGGTGGCNVANQLLNTGLFEGKDITVFDPKETHHYQPAYTMVAGGVLGSSEQAQSVEGKYVTTKQEKMFQAGINLEHIGIDSF